MRMKINECTKTSLVHFVHGFLHCELEIHEGSEQESKREVSDSSSMELHCE